jgi:hypothetical protein
MGWRINLWEILFPIEANWGYRRKTIDYLFFDSSYF